MRIGAAYETLSDENKKRDFDRTGSTRSQPQQQGRGQWGDPFAQARFDFQQRFNDYYENKAESVATKLTSTNYDHTVSPGVDESILHVTNLSFCPRLLYI
jgi:DnaJ-class molecular chaperone